MPKEQKSHFPPTWLDRKLVEWRIAMIRQHVAPAFELTATRSSIKEQTDSGFLPIVAGCVLEIMVDAKRIRFTVQRVSATFLGHICITIPPSA
jgi:hypothetical protein